MICAEAGMAGPWAGGQPVTLRPMQAADVPQVVEMLRASWHDAYANILRRSVIEKLVGQFGNWKPVLAHPTYRIPDVLFCATIDDAVAGMVYAASLPSGGRVWIWMLYVHPKYQSLGIGHALLTLVVEHYAKAQSFQLEVLAKNKKGIEFYERQGFVKAYPWFTNLGFVRTYIMRKERRPTPVWIQHS